MVRDEERRVKDYDFTRSVHEDVSVFMNPSEFGSYHDIDGIKVLSVMVSSKAAMSGEYPVYSIGRILFAPFHALKPPEPGMQTRIDGKKYVVTGAQDIQGEIWRVELQASE